MGEITAPGPPEPNARLRILYVAMRYDYGDPARGDSFEHVTFFDCLQHCGHDVQYFDFMSEDRRLGRAEMRRSLIQTAAETQADLVFFVLFQDEIDVATIRSVGTAGRAPTVNWFCDDHWRFESFSRRYAEALDWAVTTDRDAVAKYQRIGKARVHRSQWACNHFSFRPQPAAKDTDLLFVGQPHGGRRETVERLRAAGLGVRTFGFGWPEGRVSHEEMLRLVARARVVLNLSNASTPALRQLRAYVSHLLSPRRQQIKGRNFEVPGCRAALLTDYVEGLDEYFVPDREIVCFTDFAELLRKATDLLADDGRREAIAEAGYRRVLSEHTYVHRFNALFEAMGLAGRETR